MRKDGKAFLINLEGKCYSCKHCKTHLAFSKDIMCKMLKALSMSVNPTLDIHDICRVNLTSQLLHILQENFFPETFHCRHGRAYLFNNVVNVTVGERENRMMITGLHAVVDFFCVVCGATLGWKYELAYDKSQKYKEGNYILEMFMVLRPDGSSYLASLDPQLAGSDGDDA